MTPFKEIIPPTQNRRAKFNITARQWIKSLCIPSNDVAQRSFASLSISVIFAWCLFAFSLSATEIPDVTLIRTPDNGIQPQAVVDDQSVVHLIYFKGEADGGNIFYARQEPGSKKFSDPIRVNSQENTALAIGTIRGAQLALGRNGRVHVAWNGHSPKVGGYMKAPMLYTRLNDAGTAFEPERNVITSAWGLNGGGSVAADKDGNIFVLWHAPKPGNSEGEEGRAVFVAQSKDDGKTFAADRLVVSEKTGACGCCGMKAFADSHGNVFAFYRSASEMVNRNETLLLSNDHGATFSNVYSHHWEIATCPMSSAFLSESGSDVLAAEETHGRVYFVRMDAKSGKVSEPVCPEAKGKYPVVIGGSREEALLVWVEGTSWGKGGSVAWQVFDKEGNALSSKGTAPGVEPWSMAAAVARPDGGFWIIY